MPHRLSMPHRLIQPEHASPSNITVSPRWASLSSPSMPQVCRIKIHADSWTPTPGGYANTQHDRVDARSKQL
eukprot:87801-Rhodomonas_salina.2